MKKSITWKMEICQTMKKKLHKIAKRESIKDRLQHDENAWLVIEQAINEQIAQVAGYTLRLEKRITALEQEIKKLKKARKIHGK